MSCDCQVNPSMHATKQSTAEEEMRPHLRMQEGRHVNIQSTGDDQDLIAHRLKRFEGKHSGKVLPFTLRLRCFLYKVT